MKKYLRIVLIITVLIIGLFILTGCGNNETPSNETKQNSSIESTSNSKENKTSKISNSEQQGIVYWGTKGNFEEFNITVDKEKTAKDIIKDFISEISKYANYNIEIKSLTCGNKNLSITFDDSFNPDNELANKIYDSIYQTCYKALGITNNYFDLPNGEKVQRTIND